MGKGAALLLVLWLAMSAGTFGQEKQEGGHELKDGDAASKSTERAKKVALVQKFMDGALYSLAKHQTDKAEELMKGAIEYLYHDNTIKDKAAKLEEFMKEAIKFLEQDMIEKSEEMMKGAIVYLEGDDKVNDEQSGKRVKYLENNKVQARVNIVLLVDDFLNEALTYLDTEQIAKAKNVIEGMKLFVSQCDEIQDKAASFEEMIQRALTFIEQDSLEKAKEVINEAMTYLGNDDDVKELRKAEAGHAKGVKYLEQDKAERGIQKAIFVTEVLKVALTFIDKKQVEKAKEVVQGVEMYVALDDTVKDKVGSTKVILDGIMKLFQLDRVEKAKEAIQGAMTYLLGDEDVQEADKLLQSMGVEEQNKLFKDVKDKTAAKLKRVKFLENNKVQARVNIVLLVDDFLNEALTYLDAEQIAKAKNVIEGMKLFVSQCDEIQDKAAAFEEMIQRALTFIEQDSLEKAKEVINEAMTYLGNDDDVKELRKAEAGHAKGVKYLEQDKAERGIQKAIFVTEVLKVALTFIDKKQVEKAKEVVQGVEMYVALDDTVKDKVGSTKVILDGIMKLFQLDRVEKAKEAIQGAMTYLLGDEDVQEADKLLQSMGVEEQNKLFKDVKDKTAAKLKRVKFLENNKVQARVNIVLLVDDFLNEAMTYLDEEQIAKAKNVIEGMKLFVSQCDEIQDKAAAFEEMIQRALTFIEQESLEKAKEVINEAMTYLGNDDDVKELRKAEAGHAKGVKYLEQDKAERGIQKAIFVTEVLKVALTFIDKKQVEKAKEVVQGVEMYVALDDTVKDKVGSTKVILDGIMKLFQLDRVEKAKEAIQGAMTYLLGDEDVQEADKLLQSMGVEEQNKLFKDVKDKTAAKLKRVKFLENNKVQARVNIVLLVDDFLNEALTYLDAEQIAKAKNVIEGMKLFVSQCDEIQDKAAAFEEMIQRALTFIEQDSLEKAKEVINEAMTYLGNDDDVKELRKAEVGHAKGAKYLEQDKAERGIQKAIFVTEVLKVALTFIDKKQVEKAKEVVQGVEMYVALDDTVKDKVGSTKVILDGIMKLFQLDRVEKAKEAIQGAMTYLLGDEDVQEADKLLKSMGVEEQNKLFKDVKDKTAVKLKRVKFLENGGDGVGKLELVHDFVQGALIFLEKSKTEKAKEMIDGAIMCFHQDDTGKDKEAKFEEFMKEALAYLEQENKAEAEETLKRARDYLVSEDAANDKGSEL